MTTSSDTCPACGSTYVYFTEEGEVACVDCGEVIRPMTEAELEGEREADAERAADATLERQEMEDFAQDDVYSPYGNDD